MTMKRTSNAKRLNTANAYDIYSKLDSIDGSHPLQDLLPEAVVQYPVRVIKNARVVYFNFDLAIEMGLIPKDHPRKVTAALHKRLIDTFSLRIINEFDQNNGYEFAASEVKPNKYMATRYLQLQHSNKQGKTSGDGRSIWNGFVRHGGKSWDVSSRGTGVTCLAPGAVEAAKPLKTGAGTFGYGCGLADLDEVYGSAVFSEILHHNEVGTERVLTILDLGKGLGIGVRAAPSLIRPAHLFLHLKQRNREGLRKVTDFFIQQQIANGVWNDFSKSPAKYTKLAKTMAVSFARFAATLERNYIFAWLDWDGDNVLANAGIIDYGSIRQFGLRHDQYRYDDVDRFSTNLNEQRAKARLMVQVFAQMAHYLETGRKLPMARFRNSSVCKLFDRSFRDHLKVEFLKQVGFSNSAEVAARYATVSHKLYNDFVAIEKIKTRRRRYKVADGVHRPAIYNMRAFLREYPRLWLEKILQMTAEDFVDPQVLFDVIRTNQGTKQDRKFTNALKHRLRRLEKSYRKLALLAMGNADPRTFLRSLLANSEVRNRPGRITGNGSEIVVSHMMRALKRGANPADVQRAVELFIASQTPANSIKGIGPLSLDSTTGELYKRFIQATLEAEEDI